VLMLGMYSVEPATLRVLRTANVPDAVLHRFPYQLTDDSSQMPASAASSVEVNT
jgi:hypothetical protein